MEDGIMEDGIEMDTGTGSGNVWEYHGIGGTYSAGWHHLNATFTDRAGNSTRVSIYFEVVEPV